MATHPREDTAGLWADEEWVAPSVQRSANLVIALIIATMCAGMASYVVGLFVIGGTAGLPLVIAGFVSWLLVVACMPFINPYRPVAAEQCPTGTIFHITRAVWEPGQTVTLSTAQSKRKQFITENRRGRRAHLVYFFPRRPTGRHARGQILRGRRGTPRYLYELELITPPTTVYGRGSAMGSLDDIEVRVRSRQDVPKRRARDRRKD